jgi:hypothetical protein
MGSEIVQHRVQKLTSSEGGGYIAELIAYPSCQGWGRTAVEAVREANERLERTRLGVAEPSTASGWGEVHWRFVHGPAEGR